MTRRNLAAAALAVLVLPVGTVAVAAWAQIPTNELWWLAYILVCLGAVFALVLAMGWGLLWLIRAACRAVTRRRDRGLNRRMNRHIDTARVNVADPSTQATQVIQLGAAETQVLDRYEREVADLSDFYVFPGDFR